MHKHLRYGQVSATFLLRFYVTQDYPNTSMKEYIETHLYELCARAIAQSMRDAKFVCVKVSYETHMEANIPLNDIREREQKKKKPVRTYECVHCGKWHLTSVSMKRWEDRIKKNAD